MACPCMDSGNSCEQITIPLLNNYKSKYNCVVINNLYTQAQMMETYVQDQLLLLDNFIVSKTANIKSCSALNYISTFDSDMIKITATNAC